MDLTAECEVAASKEGAAGGGGDVPLELPTRRSLTQKSFAEIPRDNSVNMGLFSSISLLIGLVVGSGVFTSPGPVYEDVGSFYGALSTWIVSGLLSLLGGFCYSELGAAYPRAGGEHVYLHKAFGSLFSFLFSFTGWVTRPTCVAIMSLSLAEYLVALMFGSGEAEKREWLTVGVSVVTITLITAYCCVSKLGSVLLQNVLCILKSGSLVAFGLTGFYYLVKNGWRLADDVHGQNKNVTDSFKEGNFGKIAKGYYSALWGYDGWSSLNILAEELQNPEKNIPRTLFIGLIMITFFYVLMNVAYFAVLDSSRIVRLDAMSDFGEEAYGSAGRYIVLTVVCLSTFGGVASTIFCNSEVTVVAAADKYAPQIFARVHPKLGTPIVSLVTQSLIAIAVALVFRLSYSSLVTFYTMPFWVFYAGAAASVLVLRKKDPHTPRPFKTSIISPVVFVMWTVFMIGFSIKEVPWEALGSLALFVLGTVTWYIFIHKTYRITRNPQTGRPIMVKTGIVAGPRY